MTAAVGAHMWAVAVAVAYAAGEGEGSEGGLVAWVLGPPPW